MQRSYDAPISVTLTRRVVRFSRRTPSAFSSAWTWSLTVDFDRFKRDGAELRIEVHDSGPGIPENMKSRLFEAFARADRTHPEGLGLGLFTVKCRGPIAASGRDQLHARAGLLLCGGRESRRWTRLRADS